MRYPPEHRAKTRQKILDAAATIFRREGFGAGSVDQVMEEAGLTAGGFYAHFKSKEELFACAFLQMLRQGQVLYGKQDEQLSGPERILSIVSKYLSPQHRQMIDQGCPLPPLLADLPRRGGELRREFQELAGNLSQALAEHLPEGNNRAGQDRAFAIVALLAGGMALSRAVADEAVANRILAACRELVDVALADESDTKTTKRGKSKS